MWVYTILSIKFLSSILLVYTCMTLLTNTHSLIIWYIKWNRNKVEKQHQQRHWRMRMQKKECSIQILHFLLSLHVNIKIESRVNFEKAFYYFGITFYFTGFVTVLSLSFYPSFSYSPSLSLSILLFDFASLTFSHHFVRFFFQLTRTLYYWLSNFRLCSFILTSSIYISLHYISQMFFSYNFFLSRSLALPHCIDLIAHI